MEEAFSSTPLVFCPIDILCTQLVRLSYLCHRSVFMDKKIALSVGKPIDVDKVEYPNPEQINRMHSRYVQELQTLFNTHKSRCGVPENVQLNIIWRKLSRLTTLFVHQFLQLPGCDLVSKSQNFVKNISFSRRTILVLQFSNSEILAFHPRSSTVGGL